MMKLSDEPWCPLELSPAPATALSLSLSPISASRTYNSTMSGAPNNTAKAAAVNATDSNSAGKPPQAQNKAAQLEEDDEFEDFPVEGERKLRTLVEY